MWKAPDVTREQKGEEFKEGTELKMSFLPEKPLLGNERS